MARTPAQFAADRRRSHRASAKRSQAATANMFDTRRRLIALGGDRSLIAVYSDTSRLTAEMARKHLNVVLSGQFADFV
ncbi:hypothetical protein [Devosia sp. MC521]|uniref:hypothetical protein n=1 Tax=Devosia sp. MC521 TaxID=2759954 RepID=UPI0015FB8DD4|nr:hypothetical protein [Devosia sp. MC521]MBJ6986906.1 hypothetical protein [Devosia sp. MC521]QMW63932.1 hypothetical protein H4N61_06340 [Devosia sp. MC521]